MTKRFTNVLRISLEKSTKNLTTPSPKILTPKYLSINANILGVVDFN